MTACSIFHQLVKYETEYTQLLCNLLQRDKSFRLAALQVLFPNCPAESVHPAHIRLEVDLEEHGRPDLVIKNEKMVAILEVKLGAARQKTQLWEADKGYVAYCVTPGMPQN